MNALLTQFRTSMRALTVVFALPVLAACANVNTVGPSDSPLTPAEQKALQEARGVGVYLAARQAEANFDYIRASNLFQKVLAENPDNAEVLSRSFFAALKAGQWNRAKQLATKIVERAPSAGVSRLLLATDHMREGRYQQIIDSVDLDDDGTAILLEPIVLAWAHAGLGNSDEAIAAIRQLAGDGGSHHLYALHTAMLHDYMGNHEEAYKAYLGLLKLGGNGTRIAQAIGRFLELHDEPGVAEKFYDFYLNQVGRDPIIQREIYRMQAGETAQPFVVSPAYGLSEALYFAAYALAAETRHHEVARIYLQLSLMAAPDAEQSLLLMGQLLEQHDQGERALYYYDKIPQSSAYGLTAVARAAMVRSDLGQPDEAIKALQLLLATSVHKEERRNINTIIGAIQRQHDRWEDAAQTYTLAIDATGEPTSQDWDLFYNRGISYERAGQWTKAERDLKRAMQLDPNQAHLLNYLGYTWVDRGEHLEQGFQMIERAVELEPDDGFIVDSLGWAYYRLGRYKEAAKKLERAASLAPGEPIIIDHLGDALWKVGRRIEARFEWRRALKMNPDDDLAQQIRRKLDMGLERAENTMPESEMNPAATGNGS